VRTTRRKLRSGSAGSAGSGKDAGGLDVISALEREWDALAVGPLTRRLRLWAEQEPALAPFPTAQALLRSLRRLRGQHASENAILAALLRQARTDRLAGRVALHALLPGLKGLAGRLLLEAGEREELWSLLLAHAWARIRSYPLEERPRRIAANLLLDAAHATLAELAEERRRCARRADIEPASRAPVEETAEVEVVLARALRAGALSREEAILILRTRFEGVPLISLAPEVGVPYQTLKKRRQRAERKLLVFLGIAMSPFGVEIDLSLVLGQPRSLDWFCRRGILGASRRRTNRTPKPRHPATRHLRGR
jgi:DNA-directed RNA polymerase specialized sigma24 family protein